MPKFVVGFEEIDKNDIQLVGEKAANLGEMANAGFPIPDGFVITSHAYFDFVKENKLDIKIKHLLSTVNFDSEKSVSDVSRHIQKHIQESQMSEKLIKEITTAYNKLGGLIEYPLVAVRASVTVQDLITAFAGNKESVLNVKGDAALLEKIKQVWASLFDHEAILYRQQRKFDHAKARIALVVQKILEPEKSGVILTFDTLTNDKGKTVVEAVYGLSSVIAQGKEIPDRYEVSKSSLLILNKKISLQKVMFKKTGYREKPVKLPNGLGKKQKISDAEIIALAKLANTLEKHYYFPQGAEWSIADGQIYLIQTKPLSIENSGINTANISQTNIVQQYYKTTLQENINQDAKANLKTATKLYVNFAETELAEKIAEQNVDGVLPLRSELIIERIGIHPKQIIHDRKSNEYISKLVYYLAKVSKDFKDLPVVYRISDLKTDEYRKLAGGKQFEALEQNPALGFRGALRHIHDPEVFRLELEAIKIVRNDYGYQNLSLMLPFVRTVEELTQLKQILAQIGLEKSPNFKLWMSVGIPSNLIMLENFIGAGLDGLAIAADELVTLIMGADRENPEVTSEFNEMYPPVMWAFEHVVKTADKHGISSSIFGQTVSDYPELVRNLISWGVSSISVPPALIERTRKLLAQSEKELLNR